MQCGMVRDKLRVNVPFQFDGVSLNVSLHSSYESIALFITYMYPLWSTYIYLFFHQGFLNLVVSSLTMTL